MSFIQLRCVCGRKLKIPGKYAGRKIKCPKCDARIEVEAPATASSQPVPPPVPGKNAPETAPQVTQAPSDVPPPVSAEQETVGSLDESGEIPVPTSTPGSLFSWLSPPQQPGYQPEMGERSGVQWLAIALFLVALLGMGPALLRLINHYRLEDAPGIFCWTYLMLISGLLQLAYAVYLYQLPDWSTVWVISIVALIVTTVYAGVFVIRLLASEMNPVLIMLQLHYESTSKPQQAGWCFCMLLVYGTFTYLSGRFGIRWKQQYKQTFSSETPVG